MTASICKCPACGVQLSLSFASGPKNSSAQRNEVFTDARDLGELLEAINVETLTDREREFVEKTKERFEQYGATTRMSEKQMTWIQDLAKKGF